MKDWIIKKLLGSLDIKAAILQLFAHLLEGFRIYAAGTKQKWDDLVVGLLDGLIQNMHQASVDQGFQMPAFAVMSWRQLKKAADDLALAVPEGTFPADLDAPGAVSIFDAIQAVKSAWRRKFGNDFGPA